MAIGDFCMGDKVEQKNSNILQQQQDCSGFAFAGNSSWTLQTGELCFGFLHR